MWPTRFAAHGRGAGLPAARPTGGGPCASGVPPLPPSLNSGGPRPPGLLSASRSEPGSTTRRSRGCALSGTSTASTRAGSTRSRSSGSAWSTLWAALPHRPIDPPTLSRPGCGGRFRVGARRGGGNPSGVVHAARLRPDHMSRHDPPQPGQPDGAGASLFGSLLHRRLAA